MDYDYLMSVLDTALNDAGIDKNHNWRVRDIQSNKFFCRKICLFDMFSRNCTLCGNIREDDCKLRICEKCEKFTANQIALLLQVRVAMLEPLIEHSEIVAKKRIDKRMAKYRNDIERIKEYSRRHLYRVNMSLYLWRYKNNVRNLRNHAMGTILIDEFTDYIENELNADISDYPMTDYKKYAGYRY